MSARLPPRFEACWCGEPLPAGRRADARYCGVRCRVAALRARRENQAPRPRATVTGAICGFAGPVVGVFAVVSPDDPYGAALQEAIQFWIAEQS